MAGLCVNLIEVHLSPTSRLNSPNKISLSTKETWFFFKNKDMSQFLLEQILKVEKGQVVNFIEKGQVNFLVR